jgi:hypothetical protein
MPHQNQQASLATSHARALPQACQGRHEIHRLRGGQKYLRAPMSFRDVVGRRQTVHRDGAIYLSTGWSCAAMEAHFGTMLSRLACLTREVTLLERAPRGQLALPPVAAARRGQRHLVSAEDCRHPTRLVLVGREPGRGERGAPRSLAMGTDTRLAPQAPKGVRGTLLVLSACLGGQDEDSRPVQQSPPQVKVWCAWPGGPLRSGGRSR